VDAKLRDQRLKFADARRELPLQGAHRCSCGRRRAGVDQIGHRLRLLQIHLAVQEGALAEFAGPRRPASELERAPHQQIEHEDPAMGKELQDVLAGERLRRRVIHRNSPIDGLAAPVEKAREGGPPRRGNPAKQLAGHARHLGTRQTQDADGTPRGCTRDGRDGVR
jgi:hypothetical protein